MLAVTRRKNKRSLDTFQRSIAVLEVSFSVILYPVPGFGAVLAICSVLLVFATDFRLLFIVSGRK
jgi:hypothetical protein